MLPVVGSNRQWGDRGGLKKNHGRGQTLAELCQVRK